jgi:hypothetical protein
MDDAQHRTDGDDGSGQQARRAGLRLRDAETVATNRRDMFGDGSLLNTLAPSPSVPGDPQENSGAPAHDATQEPADSGQGLPGAGPDAAAPVQAVGEDGATPDPAASPAAETGAGPATAEAAAEETAEADFAANPASFPFAQVPQSLDAIIDSFGTQPSSEQPAGEAPSASLPPPVSSPGADAPLPADPPPVAPPSGPMAVSSIFDSLTGEPPASAAPAEEGEPPPEVPGLDMSMLGRPLPQPSPRRRGLQPAPRRTVSSEEAGDQAVETGAQPVVQAGADAGPAHGPGAGEPSADPAPPAGDLDSPPFPDSASHALHADTQAASGETEPPGAPAMPPFLELPGMGSYADDASGPPPFLEPLERGRAPQYVEEEPEPSVDAHASEEYQEPLVSGPAFSEADAPEPIVTDSASHYVQSEAAARPMFDAAAKIEAEASATAEALDNLKRFLDRDIPGPAAAGYIETPQAGSYMPGPQAGPYAPGSYAPGLDHPVPPTARAAGPRPLLGDPAQFAVRGRAPLMPLPVPPEEEGRGRSIYLLGFLTGLGLALMAGLALYILINTG